MNLVAVALLLQTASTYHFETARALYRAEKFTEALEHLALSREANEKAPLRILYRGMTLAQLQKWNEAREVLTAANGKNAEAWYWLAASEYYTKDYAAAHISIERALELRPKDGDAYRMRGLIRFQQSEWNEGYRDWIHAVKLNPRDARTMFYLGRLFQEAGQVEQAKLWLADALRVQPNHVEARTYAGMCEESIGNLPAAEQHYRKAFDTVSNGAAPFFWLYVSYSELLRRTDRAGEARKLLEEGAQRTPEAHVLHALAKVLVSAGEAERAEKLLRDAIAKQPDLAEAHYTLGRLLAATGRLDASREQMKLFQQAKAAQDARPQVKVLVQ